jgi:hypothetical protein
MLHRLVAAGQLPPLTDTIEWKVPEEESVPRLPKGYVVLFVAFHEGGFSIPTGRFNLAVLFEFGLQLQHLNPNNIQQMSHPISQGKPNASHMCARIRITHT